jgi:hypothetical protein
MSGAALKPRKHVLREGWGVSCEQVAPQRDEVNCTHADPSGGAQTWDFDE